jgi:ubiquinone/menaquinone biosynthesis C-methylase UbiE
MSLPFLRKARVYAARDGVKPVLVQADVRALPYRDGVFDALVCGGSLNEFTALPRTLAEFARVLKPGARMWQMYVSKAESPLGRMGQVVLRATGLRFLEPSALEAQAEASGLRLLRAQHRARVTLALFRKGSRAHHASNERWRTV